MHRRIRHLAALIALLAFSAFLAEEIWAAACGPEMGAAGMHAVMDHQPGADPAAADCELDDAAPEAPTPPDGAECPLMLFAGAGCASVTLPTQEGALAAISSAEALLRPVDPDRLHDLIALHGLFRPPIA